MSVARLLVLAFVAASIPVHVRAQTESIIYSFKNNGEPFDRLLEDGNGVLYGTTSCFGCERHSGTAFELRPSDGGWIYKRLHSFSRFNGDGTQPITGLTQDSTGALYGTTHYGGEDGFGTIFELTPHRSDKIIYSFPNVGGGIDPSSDLLFDPVRGVFYGTTALGGAYFCGNAFQLSPSQGGWTESVIYDFPANSASCGPIGDLTEDADGNLYGASLGTAGSGGVVYRLTNSAGAWSEIVLYQFSEQSKGFQPADITRDSTSGTLYGVTTYGGSEGDGVVFQLNNGTYSAIYSFGDKLYATVYPQGIQLDEATGKLYVTTEASGTNGPGTIIELTKQDSTWSAQLLHTFDGTSGDGLRPVGKPTIDPATDVIYGMTLGGGAYGEGAVYMISP